MTKRKLVKQGAATLMVSLPSKWARENNLGKGDEVDITEVGNSLLLSSDNQADKKIKIALDSQNKKDLQPLITHAYRRGFNKIILENTNKELAKEIQKITSALLLGFEITERNTPSCTIESVSEPSDNKYPSLLKRTHFIIKELHKLITEDISSGKYKNQEEINEIEIQLDKFILFCRRILLKSKYEQDQILNWEMLTFLMHISHAYKYFYKYSLDNNLKFTKETLSLFDDLGQYLELFEKANLEKDISAVHKINDQKERHQFGQCIKQMEKGKGKNAVALSYIKDLFRLIQIGTSPVLAEILEKDSKHQHESG